MAATADASTVFELALGAVLHRINAGVAGERVGKRLVVCRYITLRRASNGEHQSLMTRQQRFLDRRQNLIGVTVKTCVVLARAGIRDGRVTAVKQVLVADAVLQYIGFELLGDAVCALAG